MNGEFDVARCIYQLLGFILTGVFVILVITNLARKYQERRDD